MNNFPFMLRTSWDRKANRLKEWDYSQNGVYFVTICIDDYAPVFGSVVGEKMILNNRGKIAQSCWEKIPEFYKHCRLGAFVIMPSHVHGIVEILEDNMGEADCKFIGGKDQHLCDRTKMLLPKIINAFKRAVTKQITECFPETYFKWEKSFYDEIIDDEEGLQKVTDYIINNPVTWAIDKYNNDK